MQSERNTPPTLGSLVVTKIIAYQRAVIKSIPEKIWDGIAYQYHFQDIHAAVSPAAKISPIPIKAPSSKNIPVNCSPNKSAPNPTPTTG